MLLPLQERVRKEKSLTSSSRRHPCCCRNTAVTIKYDFHEVCGFKSLLLHPRKGKIELDTYNSWITLGRPEIINFWCAFWNVWIILWLSFCERVCFYFSSLEKLVKNTYSSKKRVHLCMSRCWRQSSKPDEDGSFLIFREYFHVWLLLLAITACVIDRTGSLCLFPW